MGAVISRKVKHSWYCIGLLNRSSRSAMRRFESCAFRQGNLLCHEAQQKQIIRCDGNELFCGKEQLW